MSYSVDEGIEDGERQHLFLVALKEAYPDATKNGQRWETPSLAIEDCDNFELDVETGPLGCHYVRAKLYCTIGQGRVYVRSFTAGVPLEPLFHHMKSENPDLFGQLLAWIKENA
jgi:hypothetical protein